MFRPSGRVIGLGERAHVKGIGAVAPVREARRAGLLRALAVLEGRPQRLARFGGTVLPGNGMGEQRAGEGAVVLRVAEGNRVGRQLEAARVLRFRPPRTGWT